MHCCKTVLFLTPLKKRELCYPYKTILILIQKIHLFRKLQTKGTQYIINQLLFICSKEKKVSRFSVHSSNQRIHLSLCHEFCKRRFSCAIFRNGNICKAFGTVSFSKFNQLINLFTRHSALSFCIDTTDTSAILQRRGKYAETTISNYVTYIMKFHAKTHIRFIRSKSVHSLLPGNTLNRKFYFNIQNFFKQIRQESLIYINNIIHIYKRKFHIDLCKFRLSVRTEILITEASCYLNVSVIPGTHQKLFVKLRRLRQSIEMSRMNSGRYQIISGSLRSTLSKHRSFNFHESLFCKKLSGKHHYFALQHNIFLNIRSSQIQITIFQSDLVFCLAVLFNWKRRNFCF